MTAAATSSEIAAVAAHGGEHGDGREHDAAKHPAVFFPINAGEHAAAEGTVNIVAAQLMKLDQEKRQAGTQATDS